MWLKLDLDGVMCRLRLRGYEPVAGRDWWNSEWCCVTMELCSNWLNYTIDSEVLLSSEVEQIRDAFGSLLHERVDGERGMMEFVEPDLTFQLYPSAEEPMAEMQIHIDEQGMSANYVVLALDAQDVRWIWDYLRLITHQIDVQDASVVKMLEQGTLIHE